MKSVVAATDRFSSSPASTVADRRRSSRTNPHGCHRDQLDPRVLDFSKEDGATASRHTAALPGCSERPSCSSIYCKRANDVAKTRSFFSSDNSDRPSDVAKSIIVLPVCHPRSDAGVFDADQTSISRRLPKLTSIFHRRRSPLMTTVPGIFF